MDEKGRGEPKSIVLRGTVDRLEGDYAVVVLDDGGQVLWPKRRLAEGAGVGVVVVVTMAADVGMTDERKQAVRDQLRDIFKKPPE